MPTTCRLSLSADPTGGEPPPDPPPPPPPAGAGPTPVSAVSQRAIKFDGGSSKAPPAALREALDAVDLRAALATPFERSRTRSETEKAGPKAKRNDGLARRLASFEYGIPVELPGSDAVAFDVAAAIVIQRRVGARVRTVTIALPAVAVRADSTRSTVILPIDQAASQALKQKLAVVDVAIKILVVQIDSQRELEEATQQQLKEHTDAGKRAQEALLEAVRQLNDARAAVDLNRVDPAGASVRTLRRRARKNSNALRGRGHLAANAVAPLVAKYVDSSGRARFSVKGCSKRCKFPVGR